MEERKQIRETYIEVVGKILKKFRYKINSPDEDIWKWFLVDSILLVIYHIISFVVMGTPTPVSLLLNTILVIRFIVNNTKENRKIVNKAKKRKRSTKNEYTSIHAMIAIAESIAIILMVVMILWLGIDNNIGQRELATFVILCISLFEGWKDVNVSLLEATPQTF